MAYEAIRQVIGAEQSGRDRRTEAAAEAKRILAEAEKTGQQAERMIRFWWTSYCGRKRVSFSGVWRVCID